MLWLLWVTVSHVLENLRLLSCHYYLRWRSAVQKARMLETKFKHDGVEPTFVIQLLMHCRVVLL